MLVVISVGCLRAVFWACLLLVWLAIGLGLMCWFYCCWFWVVDYWGVNSVDLMRRCFTISLRAILCLIAVCLCI